MTAASIRDRAAVAGIGVHFVSELLDCPPEEIDAGLPVRAMFEPVDAVITLVKFRRIE